MTEQPNAPAPSFSDHVAAILSDNPSMTEAEARLAAWLEGPDAYAARLSQRDPQS